MDATSVANPPRVFVIGGTTVTLKRIGTMRAESIMREGVIASFVDDIKHKAEALDPDSRQGYIMEQLDKIPSGDDLLVGKPTASLVMRLVHASVVSPQMTLEELEDLMTAASTDEAYDIIIFVKGATEKKSSTSPKKNSQRSSGSSLKSTGTRRTK